MYKRIIGALSIVMLAFAGFVAVAPTASAASGQSCHTVTGTNTGQGIIKFKACATWTQIAGNKTKWTNVYVQNVSTGVTSNTSSQLGTAMNEANVRSPTTSNQWLRDFGLTDENMLFALANPNYLYAPNSWTVSIDTEGRSVIRVDMRRNWDNAYIWVNLLSNPSSSTNSGWIAG